MAEKINEIQIDDAPNKNEIISIEENSYNSNQNSNGKEKEIINENDFKKYKDINIIKLALTKLKNKKIENLSEKIENQKEEKSYLNIKIKKDEKENNNIINIEDKKDDDDIEIIDEEIKSINSYKSDNDNDEVFDEEEEDEESFSISSNNNSNTSINSNDNNDNLINIYKRRKHTKNFMKKKISNYFRSNKRTILKRKEYYVHQLLQRWWYALPMWPPDNYDTSEKLKENNLRLVEEKNWKKEIELNSDNFQKCIELPGYKYVYLTKEGKVYDFRPEENKPTFNNLMKLNDIQIHQYLVIALTKQLEELEKRNFFSERKLRSNIKNQLKIAKTNLSHIKK